MAYGTQAASGAAAIDTGASGSTRAQPSAAAHRNAAAPAAMRSELRDTAAGRELYYSASRQRRHAGQVLRSVAA